MLNNKSRFVLKCLVFIFCIALIIHRWQHVSIYDQGFGKSWFNGDAFSSRNTLSAAQFFKDSGFTRTAFLPVFDYKTPMPNWYGERTVYTHYPALPDILAGCYVKIFNSTNRHTVAIIPLLLSVLLFFLIYRFLSDLIKNKNVAFISASMLVLSNYYIAWADDLHQHVYNEFFKWLLFYILYHYYENDRKPFYYIPIVAFIYLMLSNFSFEPIVFTAIGILGFSYIYKKSIFTKEVFILLPMPVIGFALHMFQNYLYLGSWESVYKDMHAAFLERTNGSVDKGDWGSRVIGFEDIPWLLRQWLQRFGHYFLIPASMTILLSILAFRKLRKTNTKLFQIALVFFIAGISWNFVMVKHALIHMFTLRHMGIFFGIIIGFGLYEYKDLLVDLWKRKRLGWLIVNFIFIYYTLVLIAINHIFYLYIKYGFAYPIFGTEDYQWGKLADFLI